MCVYIYIYIHIHIYIYIYIYIYIHIYTYIYIYKYVALGACNIRAPGIHAYKRGRHGFTVESRFWPMKGFGWTPGKLWTRSKPNPCPKSVRTPAQKLRNIPNLSNPLGMSDGLICHTKKVLFVVVLRQFYGGPSFNLAFTRYCYYQSCIVYSLQTRVRRGSRILPNNRALVLH